MKDVAAVANKVMANIEKVIIGKRPQLILSMVAYFCEGHILLEDVPGVAKTMLARALAKSIGCTVKRLQCTPDLLPSDVTGVSIFNPKSGEFEFRAGPIFAQIVLADEINRTTPRTQSALLEAMAERKVSVDGTTYTLKAPFLVMATQNPIDHEGTFPLPEAQLDRFLIRLSLGYPTMEDEGQMLERMQHGHPIDELTVAASAADIIGCQEMIREVFVDDKVRKYILEIVHATRQHEDIALGGSPRASIALFRAGQALAAMQSRDFVVPDDVKRLALPVLEHRIILKPDSRLRKVGTAKLLKDLVEDVPVPLIKGQGDADGEDFFR